MKFYRYACFLTLAVDAYAALATIMISLLSYKPDAPEPVSDVHSTDSIADTHATKDPPKPDAPKPVSNVPSTDSIADFEFFATKDSSLFIW